MQNVDPEYPETSSGQTGSNTGAFSTGKKRCSGCGTVNDRSSNYCYKCGLRLPGDVYAGTSVNPAGFWVRLLAFLIDQIILSTVGIVLLLLISNLTLGDYLASTIDIEAAFPWTEYLIIFALEVTYWTYTIGTWGRTAGKALLRIKVVRADGSRVGYLRSFARYLAYFISWFTLGIGFLAIPLTPQKTGLHDLICNTRVIRM